MRAWLLATWPLLCLPTRTLARTADSAAAAGIALLERRVEAAVLRAAPADMIFLGGIYARGFRYKHSTGDLQDRAQWLASVRARTARFLARDVDSLDVEVHDDVALVTGRIHVRREDGAPGAPPPAYTIRYVRLNSRRAGRWQILSHHSTVLVPDSGAGAATHGSSPSH